MHFNLFIVISTLVVVYAVHNNKVDWRERVDCFPDPNPEEAKCKERGCVWDNATYDEYLNVPLCYFPKTTGLYLETHTEGKDEWILTKVKVPPVLQNPTCPFMEDIPSIRLSITDYGEVLNIRIETANPRFEPDIKMNVDSLDDDKFLVFETNENITGETFTFKVRRKETNTVLWDTSLGGLMFADKYIQISTRLPTDKMYGFGENTHQTLKHDFNAYKTWSMFARDEAPNSVGEDTKNLYGVHPFYMMLEPDGSAHGVLILNSNAQEVTTGPGPHLVYRTIGGILDIYFFSGPTPAVVIYQYYSAIGKPFLPPFWALGFQLSRYGYKNLDELKMTVERNLNASIPLEVIYADIDYMNRYADFTTGEKWKDFGAYVKDLHSRNLKVILIFDPAIDVTTESFKRALDADASFIEYERFDQVQNEVNDLYKLTNNTKIMLSVVWPDNHVAFPDFFDSTNKTRDWWTSEFANFYRNQVEFDGIWIDMNEPAAFGTNEEHPWYFDNPDHPNITSLKCDEFNDTDGAYDYAPFQTSAVYRYNNGSVKQSLLSQKTLCMLARTHRGKEVFYNTKNLYGLYESIATYEAAYRITKKRPAIVSRNHNNKDSPPQDPAQWPEVAKATRLANNFRYSFLSHLHSLHYKAACEFGTVVQPVFFEFSDDSETHNLSYQFMWGDSMMIAPVTEERATSVSVYLPLSANWYSLRDSDFGEQKRTGWILASATLTELIPVYIRGNSIIVRQEGRITTTETRTQPLTLLIATEELKYSQAPEVGAWGSLSWNDVISIDDYCYNPYCTYEFDFSADPVKSTLHIARLCDFGVIVPPISTIYVFGMRFPFLGNLTINEKPHENYSYVWNKDKQTLKLDGFDIQLNSSTERTIEWYNEQ